MTITPSRVSKYLYEKDMSVAWESNPIRVGSVNGYFFSFFCTGAVHGILSVEYGVDWLDVNGVVPQPLAWTPSPFSWPIVGGNFTGVTPNSPNANSEALGGAAGASYITFTEALRLKWVPDGGGSAGTMSASFYAKSFG